ncbi:MAG TPA: thioredoxin domain-containing protein [Terriglobales bacterium]
MSVFFALPSVAQTADTPKPKQVVATVGDQAIYDVDLASSAEGQLQSLHSQEYDIKRKALDSLIEQKMLDNAAKAKGITTEQLLHQEVDAKVKEPNDDTIEGFYLAQSARLNRPLDDALKTQLRQAIKQSQLSQLRQDYLKQLRSNNKVVVLLSPPRVQVAHDPKRLRGNAKAPVMIVEFSDYQCPYCHQVEPTVKEILAKYGDKVSFSYRDFPLYSIHPFAMGAAEASRCAEEQGKFWEYHDQLFAASKLEKDALIQYARDLKLDDKQFESCLTSEKYKADIDKDELEGRNAGVNGTPGFFINGVFVNGAKPESEFTSIIDDELGRAAVQHHPTASVKISRVN